VKDVTFNLLSSSFGDASAKSSAGGIGSVTLTAAGAVVFTKIDAGQGIHIIPSAGFAPTRWARRMCRSHR
jgi:hypothetical protein